jgi:predicted unusual protein kinase regulating ubiquinone biosynthesis (AarF/ABC1/UbiB family)
MPRRILPHVRQNFPAELISSSLNDLKINALIRSIAVVLRLWSRMVGDARRSPVPLHPSLRRRAARKLARIAARRIDVCSEDWVRAIGQFDERPRLLPFDEIKSAVERELGRPLNNSFQDFDPAPLAVGSVAQLHRGHLRDGRECVVKVQFPRAGVELREDLKRLNYIVRLVARIAPNFKPRTVMHEVMRVVPAQLDFSAEARCMDLMRLAFRGRSDVEIPRVHRWLSTQRVLTMELADGVPLAHLWELQSRGFDLAAIARHLFEIFAEQVFVHGVIHADPTAGNVLVQPGPRLVLLDFGMSRTLSDSFRINLARLALAIISNHSAEIVMRFRELGFASKHNCPDTFLTLADLFFGSVIRRGTSYADQRLVADFILEFPRVFRSDPLVAVPNEILFLVRTMGLLNGLARMLRARMNLRRIIEAQALAALAHHRATGTNVG